VNGVFKHWLLFQSKNVASPFSFHFSYISMVFTCVDIITINLFKWNSNICIYSEICCSSAELTILFTWVFTKIFEHIVYNTKYGFFSIDYSFKWTSSHLLSTNCIYWLRNSGSHISELTFVILWLKFCWNNNKFSKKNIKWNRIKLKDNLFNLNLWWKAITLINPLCPYIHRQTLHKTKY